MKTIAQRLQALQMKHGKRFAPSFTVEIGGLWRDLKTEEDQHKFLDKLEQILDLTMK